MLTKGTCPQHGTLDPVPRGRQDYLVLCQEWGEGDHTITNHTNQMCVAHPKKHVEGPTIWYKLLGEAGRMKDALPHSRSRRRA